jgi:protein TonB
MDAAVVDTLRRVQPRDPFLRWFALSALVHAAAVTAAWLLAPPAVVLPDPGRIVYVRLAPDPEAAGASPSPAPAHSAAPVIAAPAAKPAPTPTLEKVVAPAPIPPPAAAPVEETPPPEPVAVAVVASAAFVVGAASDAAVAATPDVAAGPASGDGTGTAPGPGGAEGPGTGAAAGRGAGADDERGSGDGGADALAAYVARVRQLIEERKHYPAMARRRGLEGRVTVRIAIAPDGSVEHVAAVGGGVDLFVRATLEAVERAAPLPPPPPGFGELEVAVRYELD